MNKLLSVAFEILWNLKPLEGHRSRIASGWISASALLMAYQEAATSAAYGEKLPDAPGIAIVIAAFGSAFFAGKMKKFVKEHKE